MEVAVRVLRLILLIGTTLFLAASLAAAEPEYVPAPNVAPSEDELNARIAEAVKRLEGDMQSKPPTNYEQLRNLLNDFGQRVGLASDSITVATFLGTLGDLKADGSFTDFGNTKIGKLAGEFGLYLAVFQCIEQQFIQGRPAGLKAMHESAKWLCGKIAGGPCAAVVALIDYELNKIGQDLLRSVNEKFYGFYFDYQQERIRNLSERETYLVDLALADPTLGKLNAFLDAFWDDPLKEGIRGEFFLKGQAPDDGYKAAIRHRYVKEIVWPLVRARVQDLYIERRVGLEFDAKIAALDYYNSTITLSVPNVIDWGTGQPARDLEALLVHGRKYVIASCKVAGQGAVFQFRPGQLVDPETKKSTLHVEVHFRATAPAVGHAHGTVNLTLTAKPDTKFQRNGNNLSIDFSAPIYTRLAYPVQVSVQGGDIKNLYTRATTQEIPLLRGNVRRIHVCRPDHKITGSGSAFSIPALLTGGYIVEGTGGVFLGEVTVDGPKTLTFSAPTAGQGEDVTAPELASKAGSITGLFGQLKTYSRPWDDIWNEVGRLREAAEKEYGAARSRLYRSIAALDLEMRVIGAQNIDSAQKTQLSNQVAERRNRLRETLKKTEENRREFDKTLDNARKNVGGEIDNDMKTLREQVRAGEDEMRDGYDAANRLAGEIENDVTKIFTEYYNCYLAYQTEAEADAKTQELEALAGSIGEKIAGMAAAVEKSKNARDRLTGLYAEFGKRQQVMGYDPPSINYAFGELERVRTLLAVLTEKRAAERAQKAAKVLNDRARKRKEQTRRLLALMNDAKKTLATLPKPNAEEFAAKFVSSGDEFQKIIANADHRRERLAGLAADIKGFLDARGPIVQDRRETGGRTETEFSKLEKLQNEIWSLANGREAYSSVAFDFWKTTGTQAASAIAAREKAVGNLIRLEADIAATLKSPDDKAAQIVKDKNEIEAALVPLRTAPEKLPAGEALAILEKTYTLAATLPVPYRLHYDAEIEAAGQQLLTSGRLEEYARSANRPMLVIESYWFSTNPDGAKNPTAHNKTWLVVKNPGAEASVIFRPRLIGVDEKKTSAVIFLEVSEFRQMATRNLYDDKYGFLSLWSGAQEPKIRILGAGANPPITYPFIRQIRIE